MQQSGDTMRGQDPREPMYGAYQGDSSYQQQQYSPPPVGQNPPPIGGMYDDEFMDAFAQRLSQRMSQGPRGKVYPQSVTNRATSGQKLALAIVSVVMLVPLTGLAVALIGVSHLWIVGLMALGVICLTIFLINLIFAEKG